jgi:hypothetical protein
MAGVAAVLVLSTGAAFAATVDGATLHKSDAFNRLLTRFLQRIP